MLSCESGGKKPPKRSIENPDEEREGILDTVYWKVYWYTGIQINRKKDYIVDDVQKVGVRNLVERADS